MSVGLYMDVHVPLSVVRGLRRRGIDVLTAQEDGANRLSDPALLRRARELGRILFSQDEDLVVEAARCQRSGESFASVVFARQLDISIGRCVAELEILQRSNGRGCRGTSRLPLNSLWLLEPRRNQSSSAQETVPGSRGPTL